MTISTSRRGFLRGATAAAGALVVGLNAKGSWAAAHGGQVMPNPFVKLGPDGSVTVILKHFEMGQGTTTGLTTLVADEMDADWSKVGFEFAPVNTELYANTLMGVQGTGGSTSMANSYMQYRKAGAAARALLVQAAADEWGVPAEEIEASKGMLSHGDHSAAFAEIAPLVPTDATPPEEPQLKSPDRFTLIGKDDLPRKDSNGKTDGTATFALDVKVPDMVYAVLKRAPKFGGKLVSFDDTEARKVPGVLEVKQTPMGVAVYATGTWAAIQGREALTTEWDFSEAETRSTDQMEADYKAALDGDGPVARQEGDAPGTLEQAENVVEAEFSFPFLAHAPMEPLNCVIQVKDGKITVWDGSQFPTVTQGALGAISGLGGENVAINTVYAGGSFGRRANFNSDYEAEALMMAMALDDGRPVKHVWTREDDIKGGYYRPMTVHRIRMAVDGDKPLALHSKIANKSIFTGTPMEGMAVKDGIDSFSVEGAADTEYAIPNLQVEVRNMPSQVPVLWWRSVGHSHTGYAMEVAIDMMAEAAGVDPVEFRRTLLADSPRHLGVLNAVAEKAGWGSDLPEGWGRGIAVHKSFNTYVAEVAEVSTTPEGRIKLERVVAAVDLGTAVNPDVIRAQLEGGIGFALGHVMRDKITFTEGEVDQFNFPDYEPLRMRDMPKVEVHIVESEEAPTGVGEPGVPPAGPALANAIYAATGKRVTRLPMIDDGIEFA